MRVLVTGSTGMVGSHACKALLAAGHEVRALVRDVDRARQVHARTQVPPVEYAHGDVTDAASIDRALDGCDAVVHAAAMILFDKARRDEMFATNVGGTQRVLEAAHARKLDPVVLVSSIAALWTPGIGALTEETEIASPQDSYGQTKAEAERIARALQAEGAPVVTFYPGAVWGPDNPTVGDQITTIFAMVKGGYYASVEGGMPIVDARDLADAIARSMEPGRGPRRYMMAGHYQSHDEMRERLGRIRGKKLWRAPIPAWLLRFVGRVGDVLFKLGIDPGAVRHEAMLIATSGLRGDDRRSLEALGMELRDLDDTIEAQMRWMHANGYLTAPPRRPTGRARRRALSPNAKGASSP